MIWHFIKYWIAFILPSFYKRIQGKNADRLKIKGPAIIAMNHPNAFTDPIAITYVSYPLRLKYMARGDAFKPGIISWLLEQIGIVPIFRIQDGGVEGLKKNDAAYARVNALLKQNAKIIVFAEGLCVQERRLRPLKKGVSRMVFGAFEAIKDDRLMVLPVGVNYSQPNKFRSNIFYNIGEPIYVKDYIGDYRQNPAKANTAFLQLLEPKLKALITHINDKSYDAVVHQVEELCKRDLIESNKLDFKNLSHDFDMLNQLTEKVNSAVINNREVVDTFRTAAHNYFRELKKHRLKDWLINPRNSAKINPSYISFRIFLLVLGSPLYLLGLMGNYLPFILTEYFTKRIVKKKLEFYSSFAIGLSMFFFLVNYLLWFVFLTHILPNALQSLVACIILALSAWFCLFYHPYMLKTLGMLRILKNKKLATKLTKERKDLISLIERF